MGFSGRFKVVWRQAETACAAASFFAADCTALTMFW
jgi:hypothetical protein